MQRLIVLTMMLIAALVASETAPAKQNSVLLDGPSITAPKLIQPDADNNVQPAAETTVHEEVIPAPVRKQPVAVHKHVTVSRPVKLVPVHSVNYLSHPSARRALACHGSIDTILAVDNPCDGSSCLYEVPVCIPACCVGEPRIRHRRGLLGRGVAVYCWSCGYEVEVIFRLRGDVMVKSYGG